MNFTTYIVILFILWILEYLYFQIAKKYLIFDKPNNRSSHSQPIIRGGGIIFPISVIVFSLFSKFQYPFFLMGIIAVSIVSFVDDKYSLSSKIRIVFHLLGVLALIFQLNLQGIDFYFTVGIIIVSLGILNGYNFMDGINGITSLYSSITLLTLLYINKYIIYFIEEAFIIFPVLSLIVFSYYNVRRKAICFAGDVGSISMAFIIIFLLLKLIIKTQNYIWCFIIIVYCIDIFFTIAIRLSNKENIFEAHKKHLYQLLIHEKKLAHLTVSIMYAITQLALNILVVIFFKEKLCLNKVVFSSLLIITLSIGYFFLRYKVNQPLNKILKKDLN